MVVYKWCVSGLRGIILGLLGSIAINTGATHTYTQRERGVWGALLVWIDLNISTYLLCAGNNLQSLGISQLEAEGDVLEESIDEDDDKVELLDDPIDL